MDWLLLVAVALLGVDLLVSPHLPASKDKVQ